MSDSTTNIDPTKDVSMVSETGDVTGGTPPSSETESNPPLASNGTPLPMVAVYAHRSKIMTDEHGNQVIGVFVTRTRDVEYAEGITLEEYLLSLQSTIAAQAATIASIDNHAADAALFLTERFGYEYGNHSAADAFVPLFEYVEKVPTPEGEE